MAIFCRDRDQCPGYNVTLFWLLTSHDYLHFCKKI